MCLFIDLLKMQPSRLGRFGHEQAGRISFTTGLRSRRRGVDWGGRALKAGEIKA